MVPSISEDGLRQEIRTTPYSGCSCYFVKLDDEWGIKCYKDYSTRDRCFEQQSIYASEGFAPPVGSCFNIGDWKCYSTRVAQVFVDETMDMNEWDVQEEIYLDEISKKIKEIQSAGLYVADEHIGNWGRYEGELVFIDFDHI